MSLNRTDNQIKYGDKGKSTEQAVQSWLDARAKFDIRFNYHRMPDARAARGALSKQPSDFLVGVRGLAPGDYGRTYWLEVKELKEGRRLPRARIRQYGMLKVWAYSSIQPIVVVHHLEWKRWMYLTASDLFEEGADGEPVKSYLLAERPSWAFVDQLLNYVIGA